MIIKEKDFKEIIRKNTNRSYCIYDGSFKTIDKDGEESMVDTNINGFRDILYKIQERERESGRRYVLDVRYRGSVTDSQIKQSFNNWKLDLLEFIEDIDNIHSQKVLAQKDEVVFIEEQIQQLERQSAIKRFLTRADKKKKEAEKKIKVLEHEISAYAYNEYTLFKDSDKDFEEKLGKLEHFPFLLNFVQKKPLMQIMVDSSEYEGKINFIKNNFVRLMFEYIEKDNGFKKENIKEYIQNNLENLFDIKGVDYQKVIDYNKSQNNGVLKIEEERDVESENILFRISVNKNFIYVKRTRISESDIIEPLKLFVKDNPEEYKTLGIKEIDRLRNKRVFVFKDAKKREHNFNDLTDEEDSEIMETLKSKRSIKKKSGLSYEINRFLEHSVEQLEFDVTRSRENELKNILETVNSILTDIIYGVFDHIEDNNSFDKKEYKILKTFFRERMLTKQLEDIGSKKIVTRAKKI